MCVELKPFETNSCSVCQRYIVGTLDLMVSENYVMVYLCGMASRNKMPNVKWLRRCYTAIDRRCVCHTRKTNGS